MADLQYYTGKELPAEDHGAEYFCPGDSGGVVIEGKALFSSRDAAVMSSPAAVWDPFARSQPEIAVVCVAESLQPLM